MTGDQAKALNDFKVAEPVAGYEVHQRWLNISGPRTQPSYLVINKINSTALAGTRVLPVRRPSDFALGKGQEDTRSAFDPLFSPDGRYILFKFGFSTSPGTYRPYIYDSVTGQLKLACSLYISYYAVSWSPDSNYIAFAKGDEDPRMYDNGRTYAGKLQLYVANWRTGESWPVAAGDSLRGPWAWKAPHTLLYGSLTAQDAEFLQSKGYKRGADFVDGHARFWERLQNGPKRTPVAPNIYEYSLETHRSTLLVKDGYLPVISPDGRRLAFFGSGDPLHPVALNKEWKFQPAGLFLVIADARADGASKTLQERSARVVLSRHNGRYPDLVWMPDSRRLLAIDLVAAPPKARLEIREWDIETRHSRLVAMLTATDPVERSDNDLMFRVLRLSRDGKFLMVLVDEYFEEAGGGGTYFKRDTLRQIELNTGRVTTVGEVEGSEGIDWYYGDHKPLNSPSRRTMSKIE